MMCGSKDGRDRKCSLSRRVLRPVRPSLDARRRGGRGPARRASRSSLLVEARSRRRAFSSADRPPRPAAPRVRSAPRRAPPRRAGSCLSARFSEASSLAGRPRGDVGFGRSGPAPARRLACACVSCARASGEDRTQGTLPAIRGGGSPCVRVDGTGPHRLHGRRTSSNLRAVSREGRGASFAAG